MAKKKVDDKTGDMSAHPDTWLHTLPFKNPTEAAEYWVERMKEHKPDLNLGFYEFFVRRMFMLFRDYHPSMIYRLIEFYPVWASREPLFARDFPSPSDFVNEIGRMARDLFREAGEYHSGSEMPLGRPDVSSSSWEDRVFGRKRWKGFGDAGPKPVPGSDSPPAEKEQSPPPEKVPSESSPPRSSEKLTVRPGPRFQDGDSTGDPRSS